jgi:cytochrome b involved in lipid metabolism
MKKSVAIAYIIFVVAMGTMFVWGFIDKQSKESQLSENEATTNQTSSDNVQDTSSGTQQSATSSFTLADVAKHNKPSDCWLAIRGAVYNVTNYVDLHPGGADLILMYCGKDATQAYNTQGGRGRGHSSRADAQLANYKLGDVK